MMERWKRECMGLVVKKGYNYGEACWIVLMRHLLSAKNAGKIKKRGVRK